jgi:hypothetical protein
MPTTILDAEGNEHPLEMGDLVRHKDNPAGLGVLPALTWTLTAAYVDYECCCRAISGAIWHLSLCWSPKSRTVTTKSLACSSGAVG